MATTELLYQKDSYLTECNTRIMQMDENGVQLEATPFYPMGGGQLGDTGVLVDLAGNKIKITDTRKDRETGAIVHCCETTSSLKLGDEVVARIDWSRRHRLMRMHTCLHLLCAVVDGGVTGGSVSDLKGRLDFDLPEQTLDKVELTKQLNRLIEESHEVTSSWITDEALQAKPEMVRTMSVKPPVGQGRVRIINIEGTDMQPCGGTHVVSTAEIGPVRVAKIEKKGRSNRRVNIVFDE